MFRDLAALLPEGVDINKINMWHKANRRYHEICRTPAILDYVEDLIGPDFYQWGGQFFVKYPGDGSIVPWHQDAQYWPLSPRRTVTVWLALYDADAENAAMQVVRGSHRAGELRHHINENQAYVLEQEVDADCIDRANIVTLDLKAGEVRIGTRVLLQGDDRDVEFTILGPWESDPENGVISYESELGEHLLGAKKGEAVEAEGRSMTVVSISVADWDA